MTWKSIPKADRCVAKVYAGDAWIDREIKDLRPGDIARWMFKDEPVHPTSLEPDDESVAIVCEHPVKNSPETTGRERGYGIMVQVYSSFEAAQQASLN